LSFPTSPTRFPSRQLPATTSASNFRACMRSAAVPGYRCGVCGAQLKRGSRRLENRQTCMYHKLLNILQCNSLTFICTGVQSSDNEFVLRCHPWSESVCFIKQSDDLCG
jgi:hypothetical protein